MKEYQYNMNVSNSIVSESDFIHLNMEIMLGISA